MEKKGTKGKYFHHLCSTLQDEVTHCYKFFFKIKRPL
jgi:hypothetical protein